MSSRLWKAYYEDDVESFRKHLETSVYGNVLRRHPGQGGQRGGGGGGGYANGASAVVGSPGGQHHGLGTSPVLTSKSRRGGGVQTTPGSAGYVAGGQLTKADINGRDAAGMTLLHYAVSSTGENATGFATALIEHPLIDLYVQDLENGWTALHRAFYFGNVSVARMMLERDSGDALGKTTGHVHQTIGLVKVKDKEGNGPLDLFAASIKDRTLRPDLAGRNRSGSHGSEEEAPRMAGDGDETHDRVVIPFKDVDGDQLFTFGSNQNVTLGFGDEDDRQFPERISLRRPEHLIRRFYAEHLDEVAKKWSQHDASYAHAHPPITSEWIEDLPFVIRSRPQIVQDVQMSKFSSAVITSDPEANLYMCGHGQGGRLGTGDELTRFNFVCVEGGSLAGKRIVHVALGQNHTMALSDEGEIFSWGNNGYGQLGYNLPKTSTGDEDPISTIPRQIYGILKREIIVGIAASRIHSVAHTSSALYTFGKNEGQLGIMDSDARSLEVQATPRKIAASLFASPIEAVCAIDKATVCLLESREVWVFANYGYAKVSFPLEGFTNYFLKQSFLVTSYDSAPNRIVKLTGGGDTICAMSSRGEVYTLSISQKMDNSASASTTNPAKIRSAIGPSQCIWSPKKNNMAARDVGVDADGSIILSTEEGSVWKRTKRAKIKDATAAGGEYKPKDYKFSRIPGLTRVLAVRASAYGAYAAVRRDCDVLKTQVVVEEATIWGDMLELLSLRALVEGARSGDEDDDRPRFWQGSQKSSEIQLLTKAIVNSKDIEADLSDVLASELDNSSAKYDAILRTSTSDLAIPVHRFLLTGRSKVLRRGFRDLCETSTFTLTDMAMSELDKEGRVVVNFQGLDILTLIDLALYLYTDSVIDFWHMTRLAPTMAYRYRQVRIELMKVAAKLDLVKLEPAVRQMVMPQACLGLDLQLAFDDPAFFHDGDIVVQLEDDELRIHSALACARCPFFEGLFMGRAGGRWLADRATADEVNVDLSHISSATFSLVLRHIYADTGDSLFDDVVSVGLDDFLDAVMDVMSAANELMLDRLSQICQSVIGRHVNVRNVCGLLNAISPSSVHEFKDAGLEYLCLNLEAMLQGHHLNELDEDLLGELDDVVRENQLACMPFAKSGRAETLLHERHPELAAVLDRSRQTRIDAATLRSRFQDLESFQPGSWRDDLSSSPMAQKSRRRSSNVLAKTDTEKPSLQKKASTKDMMFAMDEESDGSGRTPDQSPLIRPMTSTRNGEALVSSPPDDVWFDSRGKVLPSPKLAPQVPGLSGTGTPQTPRSPAAIGKTPPSTGGLPWTFTPLPAPKTDLRNIMAQTASTRTSSLSQSIAAERPMLPATPSSFSLGAPKLSQKDRKRMQQSQSSASAMLHGTSQASPAARSPAQFSNPWQQASGSKSSPFSDAASALDTPPSGASKPASSRGSSTPQLTMRQTVANGKQAPLQKPFIGPGGQGAVAQRTVSESKVTTSAPSPRDQARPSITSQASNSKPVPHSIRHQPVIEPILGLSMSEIVAQEQAAKDEIKQAVAKRDLQDIQAEQEFQEWWAKESARVQEAERKGSSATTKGAKKKPHHRGGGGGKAGRGGKGKQQSQQSQPSQPSQSGNQAQQGGVAASR